MQTERTNNNSMITVWKSCRVIGLINSILAGAIIVAFIVVLVIGILEKTEYISRTQNNSSFKFFFTIFILLQILLFSILLRSNYRLIHRNTPSDGSVINQWLYYNKFFSLYIVVITSISIIFYHMHVYSTFSVCVLIPVLVEIHIVNKFKDQMASSGVVNQPSSA